MGNIRAIILIDFKEAVARETLKSAFWVYSSQLQNLSISIMVWLLVHMWPPWILHVVCVATYNLTVWYCGFTRSLGHTHFLPPIRTWSVRLVLIVAVTGQHEFWQQGSVAHSYMTYIENGKG